MTALAHTTAPGWHALPGRAPGVAHPASAPRPALHLVPTGRAVRARATAPVRISRFGRLMVSAAVLIVAVILVVTVVGAGSASAGIDHTVTVVSGQTLSGIAQTELPQLPIAEGVAQIRLANGLNTEQIHAGQALAIPSVG